MCNCQYPQINNKLCSFPGWGWNSSGFHGVWRSWLAVGRAEWSKGHVPCQLCGDALTWTDMFPANFVDMLWPGLTCSLPTLWRCSDLDWHVPCQLCRDALTWTDMFPANFVEMLWPGLTCSLPTLWRCSDLDWHVPCQLCGDALTWTDMFPANIVEMLWPGLTCSLPT